MLSSLQVITQVVRGRTGTYIKTHLPQKPVSSPSGLWLPQQLLSQVTKYETGIPVNYFNANLKTLFYKGKQT